MKNISFIWVLLHILSGCAPSASELNMERIQDCIIMADSIRISDSIAAAMEQSVPDSTPKNKLNLNTHTPAGKKFIKSADIKFKVRNVYSATEQIQDLAYKYQGYLTYSNLWNDYINSKTTRIRRDSIVNFKEMVVFNEMRLRIPNDRLDSFIRELNSLVVFLDYRSIKMDEVSLQFLSGQKKQERFQKYEQRQVQHIDNKQSKLKDATSAEDNLLDKQNQSDEIALNG